MRVLFHCHVRALFNHFSCISHSIFELIWSPFQMIFMCVGSMDQTEHRQFLSLFIFHWDTYIGCGFKMYTYYKWIQCVKLGIRARKITEWVIWHRCKRNHFFFTSFFFFWMNEEVFCLQRMSAHPSCVLCRTMRWDKCEMCWVWRCSFCSKCKIKNYVYNRCSVMSTIFIVKNQLCHTQRYIYNLKCTIMCDDDDAAGMKRHAKCMMKTFYAWFRIYFLILFLYKHTKVQDLKCIFILSLKSTFLSRWTTKIKKKLRRKKTPHIFMNEP